MKNSCDTFSAVKELVPIPYTYKESVPNPHICESQRKQKVGLKSCFSCLNSIFAGVPQGSVLGPLFFGIHK